MVANASGWSALSLVLLVKQLLGLLLPALVPVCRPQVGHARQRIWVISPELDLASLHHLHKQLLGLLSPASVLSD